MSKGPLRELARLFDLGQLLAIGVELRQQLFRGLAEIHGDARGRNRLEMQLRQLRVMTILLRIAPFQHPRTEAPTLLAEPNLYNLLM